MSTSNRVGGFKRNIMVTTNDPQNPRVQLVCRGRALVPLKMRPLRVSLGSVPRDASAQHKTVDIRRGDGGPIAPELMPGGVKGVEAKLREIEPGEHYALDITVSPPWPNGPLKGWVKLATGVAEAPTATVQVSARIEPRVAAVPRQFTVPSNPPEGFEPSVYLKWSGEPPGKIVDATCTDGKVTLRVDDQGGRQRVFLNVPAGYAPAHRAAYVNIRTDDAEVPVLRVPVRFGSNTRRAQAPSRRVRRPASRSQASPVARTSAARKPTATATNQPAPKAAGSGKAP